MLQALAEALNSDQVKALRQALGAETRPVLALMNKLGLSHRPTFRKNYLNPALNAGLIEITQPAAPLNAIA